MEKDRSLSLRFVRSIVEEQAPPLRGRKLKRLRRNNSNVDGLGASKLIAHSPRGLTKYTRGSVLAFHLSSMKPGERR
jgi:hypothetical protein